MWKVNKNLTIRHKSFFVVLKFLLFTEEHFEPARDLFLENCVRERQHNPLLPAQVFDDPTWFPTMLQLHFKNPGVAILERDQFSRLCCPA